MCRSGGWSTFEVGKTLLEVTLIGKGSHTRCAIYCQDSDCVMPKEGLLTKVITGGVVTSRDAIEGLNLLF